MNELERLIQKHCPSGVEYKTIGECVQKTSKIKWTTATGCYAYIDLSSVDRDTHQITDTLTICAENAPSRAQQIVRDGDILFGTTRPTLKRYCLINQEYDGHICSTGFCVLRAKKSIVSPRWLFHIVSSSAFCNYVEANQKGASYPAISDKEVKLFRLPVPPIEVQNEIVSILDNFTELTAELTSEFTAELEARKQQYEYYRDSLLTFSDDVPMYPLGDICTVQAGGTPSKKKNEYWENGTIKWLSSSVCKDKKTVEEVTAYISEEGFNNSSARMMKKNTTLIALVGATIGKVAFLPFEATINQNIAGIYPNDMEQLNPSYIYYACKMLYPKFVALTQGTKLAMANMSFVRGIKIPVPPIAEQNRVVAILERLDDLCNDISACISTEIVARQKQYEYYRDKLLTFEEKKS